MTDEKKVCCQFVINNSRRSVVVHHRDDGRIDIDLFGRAGHCYRFCNLSVQEYTEIIRFINYDSLSKVFPA